MSSDSEDIIINNFYTGAKSEIISGIGTATSNKLIEYYSDTFSHPYIANFLNRIIPEIKNDKFDELNADYIFDHIGLPNFNLATDIPSYDFYGIMGGTQKIKVELELKTIIQKNDNLLNSNTILRNYSTKTVKINAIFHIIDWYGADEDDINGTDTKKSLSESLKAFFMLQHYWGVGHPFQTKIISKLINEFTVR